MKRLLAVCLPLSLFAACGPPPRTDCQKTGCSAGSTCNPTTGACEIISVLGGGGGETGGGGGATGGGGGTTGGGGGATGGGGGAMDAGMDAGVVVDPFDDGGVFVPGDICSNALQIDFDGGTTATLSVDLATAQDQYAASCNDVGNGNDLIFAVTLTAPKGLVVSATDTTGGNQDAVLALVSSPCPTFNQVSCVDTGADPEVLTLPRLPAGTWYVLLENYGDAPTDGTFDLRFDLIDPVPAPANDTCAAAEPLVFTSGVARATGTTTGAFNDTAGSPLTCSAQSALSPDVFYTLTLTQPQDVQVSITVPGSSNLSPAIALTATCGVGGAASQRGCDANNGSFTARGVAAGTYFIVVDGDDSDTGDFTLDVTLSAPTPAPMNDTCATPATLLPNVTTNVDANAANGDYTFTCATAAGGDVVYQFTTTAAQKVTLTATGTGGADAVLSLRGAPCDDSTNEVSCMDDYGNGPETITANNLPAGTWYVVLAAYGASAGNFGLQLTLEPPVLPPVNDTCAMPTTLVPNTTQVVDLSAATADYQFDCASPSGGDVVFTFTTTQPQRVVVTATGVGFEDGVLSLRGMPCDTSADLRCANNGGIGAPETLVSNNLPAGTYFVILGSDGFSALFGVQLTLEPPRPPPTNESCTSAETVTLTNGMATRLVDLTDATADVPSDLCTTNADGQDVVYEVTVPPMETLTVVVTPTGLDLDPLVFARSPVCAMNSEVCVDDGVEGEAETLLVPNPTASPKTVFVVVKAYDALYPGEVNITFSSAP